MVMTILLFFAGFSLSSISAVYAVIGLLSIFPAAPITITLMASALELSKLVIASWLYRNWKEIPGFLKLYFSAALIILMLLTSMAVFGYLSKAHMDSSVATGDQTSALMVVDEKIATQKENIAQDRKALAQMDAAVNELMSRTTDDQGASKAVRIRKQQAAERADLNKEIALAQANVSKLQTERAPLASAVRKVEAEVGPIRYIANLIYGDKIDETILEKAVRLVILMIVFVFDPLAVLLLIAANWQLKNLPVKVKTIVTKHHVETTEDTTSTSDEFGLPEPKVFPPMPEVVTPSEVVSDLIEDDKIDDKVTTEIPSEPIVEVQSDVAKVVPDVVDDVLHLPVEERLAALAADGEDAKHEVPSPKPINDVNYETIRNFFNRTPIKSEAHDSTIGMSNMVNTTDAVEVRVH